MGEALMKGLSDRGSTPLRSISKKKDSAVAGSFSLSEKDMNRENVYFS